MSLTDLLKNTDGANITVAIGLKDLQEWHNEVVNDALTQKEQALKAKAEDEFLSPTEACKMLSVSRSTLTRWQNSGYLVPAKIGGNCRYRASDIESLLNSKNS